MIGYLRKLSPYMIIKGIKYLRHFGLKEFWIRLQERTSPEEIPYASWYAAYAPSEKLLEKQRSYRFASPVKFSVVVPVYRTNPRYLREMIDSVKAQTYAGWELCLANADPSDEAVARVLEEALSGEPRIKVRQLPENGGIAANTNAAAAMAEGDYLCFADHDDLLSPAALFKLAEYLNQHPDAQMIYTDEDKITADGAEHLQPNLKPDFNLDLLRSNNYICHLLCLQRGLFTALGGIREGFDGAQDYDLVLRASEMAAQIGHVPEILYHWRMHAESTADNPLSKEYAYEAGRRAIKEHLSRQHVEGEVQQKKDRGFYRVVYPVKDRPLISVIIPTKDEAKTLKACLDSITQKSTYPNMEILLVENHSTQKETFAYYRQLRGQENIRLLRWDKEFNYSAINNYAARHAKGEYLLFLNNDTRVITPDWIEEMLGVCQRPEVGAVGARMFYPDHTVQHAGIVIGVGGIAASMFVGMKQEFSGYMHKAAIMQDLSAVTAACMMMRRSVFEQMGGFEEKLRVAFNDVDLCLRLREAGYLVVYDPYVMLYHDESKTRGAEDSKEKVRRFQQEIEYMRTRHIGILRGGDPCYNKNLSVTHWNYSLREGAKMT